MELVHINSGDYGGGAARFVQKMHMYFLDKGVNSKLYVGFKRGYTKHTTQIFSKKNFLLNTYHVNLKKIRFLNYILNTKAINLILRIAILVFYYINSYILKELGVDNNFIPGISKIFFKNINYHHNDTIFHVNNLHGDYFDLSLLKKISRKASIVLTMHDAWLLSGHCAHSLNCTRWLNACGKCPDLSIYSPVKRDATAYNLKKKKDIFSSSKIYLVTPCQWLMDLVQLSYLKDSIISSKVIYNGVDTEIFKTLKNKREIRSNFGIGEEDFVFISTGENLKRNEFKNIDLTIKSFESLSHNYPLKKLVMVFLGYDGQEIIRTQISENSSILFFPYVEDDLFIAKLLGCSNVYIQNSIADTFPSSVLEAMSCGLPVIGTKVGGIPEQINSLDLGFFNEGVIKTDSVNGILIKSNDSVQIYQSMEKFVFSFDSNLYAQMSNNSRIIAESKFTIKKQFENYKNFYEEILKGN